MKKILQTTLALLLVTLPSVVFSQQHRDQLHRFLTKKMRNAGIIGMQVGYITSDNTTWTHSYGLKHTIDQTKVNDSTLFMIASSTKPITALGVLKLYNDGKIDLDDNVSQYLPFPIQNPNHPDKPISFRMLLAHSSTIKDDWDVLNPLYTVKTGGDSPWKLKDFMKAYFHPDGSFYNTENNFLKEAPGTQRAYSNMGYTLLGYLIEVVSGQPFEQYMYQQIFEPLGMNDTYWFLRDIPHQNIAQPHEMPDKKSENKAIKVLPHYGYADFPDGQIRTTVTDYLKFLRLILNKGELKGQQFIKKDIIKLFHTIQFPEANKHQAVAWNYNEFDNGLYYLLMRRLPSHTGGDPGVATVVSYDPEKDIAAVVFINSPPKSFNGAKIFYLDILKKLLKTAAKNSN